MRSIRYIAPLGAVGAIALAAWVPAVTASAATPNLPAVTAQQLLARVGQANVSGLSGTVNWTANLGLPSLSALGVGGQKGSGGSFDPTTLLSGSHDIKVWYGGPDRQRLALPGTLSEVDVIHNGADLWSFDSATMAVTHYVGPMHGGVAHGHKPGTTAAEAGPLTPDQVAAQILSGLTPSTTVSVASPVFVAGRPTYELVLTPKAATSTVARITMAVDSATGLPLRVQVTPKGTATPALSLGYTSVTFAAPAASTFAAPVGTSTVTKSIGAHGPGGHRPGGHPSRPEPAASTGTSDKTTVVGTDWTSVLRATGVSLGSAGHRLDQVSTPVSGTFGTGRLVHTALLNALILPDGRVLAGFVTPAALEAAVAAPAGVASAG